MGTTLKAYDTNLHCEVALKVINATYLDSELALQRFVREARAAAKLRHRNVATVFHLGEEQGSWFYAMEFIDGETVDALIKREGPLEPRLALQIAGQVARALKAANDEGLIHRDIKPANLMLVHEDEDLVVKVIDFGLAKSAVPDASEEALTMTQAGFVGTPHYASPEQLEERELDIRSDIYSLGATLWYMLAGKAPFSGTMAQVMSQHLSAPPPFERFAHWPPTIVALLDRMLEKDATKRPQNPGELRLEIDRTLEKLGASAVGTPTPQTTQGEELAAGRKVGSFFIEQDLGEGSAGRIFRAQYEGASVRLVALDGSIKGSAFTRLEQEIAKVRGVQHPGLLGLLTFEVVEGQAFVAFEWTSGYTLIELLRARHELAPDEVFALLRQIAPALDCATAAGLERIEVAPHQVYLDFGTASLPPAKSPLAEWPTFTVKIHPLAIEREASAEATWDGAQTLDSASQGERMPTSAGNPGVRYLAALGRLVYEALGGNLARITLRWAPLAQLTERGNGVLRKAVEPAAGTAGWESAIAFAKALEEAEATSGRVASRPAVERSAGPYRSVGPDKSSKPLLVAASVLVLGSLAVGAWFLFPKSQPVPESRTIAVATATPEPAVEPSPTVQPTPTRQDALKAALELVEARETAGDWPATLEGYAKIAADFPESEVGVVRLGIVSERLRFGENELQAADFPRLRAGLEAAAQRDVLPAMFLLAEHLQKSDPVTAFNWYCAASERGLAEADTQAGLMLSNGLGVARDLNKAFWYFQRATDRGDSVGTFCLAECFFYGKGTEKNQERAVELLRIAVEKGNARAMNMLGDCLHRGLGVPRDSTAAAKFFQNAADRGHYDALGNLAVLYMNGEGVPTNKTEGLQLFAKGAKLGSVFCMFQYARCLEAGNGVAIDRSEATRWYRQAASGGHRGALEWCQKNGVQPLPP